MEYQDIATQARKAVLNMIHKAQTSHIGSNFSVIDLLTVLYEKANITKENWENRDRIILSKGWAAASLYYFLNRKGLISDEDLGSYCGEGSKFIGLAEPVAPGIEFAGGSMGHGLPAAVGMAIAAKRAGQTWKTYCVMSDGEMAIGTTYESALIAAHHKLDNLTVIVDYNKWQAMGRIEDVLSLKSLHEKWKAFGWSVIECDGHSYEDIESSIGRNQVGKPHIVIAHTIKGKGVSFMEDKLLYHYKNVSDEEYELACIELDAKK